MSGCSLFHILDTKQTERNGEACRGTGTPAFSIPQPRGRNTLVCHNPDTTVQNLCRVLCRTVPQFVVPDPYNYRRLLPLSLRLALASTTGTGSVARGLSRYHPPCKCGRPTGDIAGMSSASWSRGTHRQKRLMPKIEWLSSLLNFLHRTSRSSFPACV